ncbi:MAG: hypothetical protein WA869_08605, partial [Alloacidobacterium sp.]
MKQRPPRRVLRTTARVLAYWFVAMPPAPAVLAAKPSQIRFENRQSRSGVSFVLDNGTTED